MQQVLQFTLDIHRQPGQLRTSNASIQVNLIIKGLSLGSMEIGHFICETVL